MPDLTTEFRPTTFDEVIGHETIVKALQGLLERDDAHAFVFTGASGLGKTTLARIVASELGTHESEILEVDGATHTGVDAWRDISRQLKYRPVRGESRVIIVDEAHMLSRNAWTSLLKDIEEPPSYAYWIFCTTERGKILKAVQTRARCFDLRPVARGKIEKLLTRVLRESDHDIPGEVLDRILRHADGSPRQALADLSACWDLGDAEEAASVLATVHESGEAVDLARALFSDGCNWRTVVSIVSHIEQSPETVRIIVERYATAVAIKAKGGKLEHALDVIAAFVVPYPSTASNGSLLLSLADLLLENR